MPRIRSIHPDACRSKKLAAISAEAERCYWRLQTHCDDGGRCEDDPQLLASYLFPLTDSHNARRVDGWLRELAENGLIARYHVGGIRYLQVVKWDSYQHPKRPTPSPIPAPTEEQLTHNSPTQVELVPLGVGEGGEKEKECSTELSDSEPPPTNEELFASFWKHYPRRVGKAEAKTAFVKALKVATVEEIADGLVGWVEFWEREKRADWLNYVPYPATWLNAQRWADTPEAVA